VAAAEEVYDLDDDAVDDDKVEAEDQERRRTTVASIRGNRGVEQLSLDALSLKRGAEAALITRGVTGSKVGPLSFDFGKVSVAAAATVVVGPCINEAHEEEEAGLGAALKRCRIQEPGITGVSEGAGDGSSGGGGTACEIAVVARETRKREITEATLLHATASAAEMFEGMYGDGSSFGGNGSDGWICSRPAAPRTWTVSPRPTKRMFRRLPALLDHLSQEKERGGAEKECSTDGFALSSVPEHEAVAAWVAESADTDNASEVIAAPPAAPGAAAAKSYGVHSGTKVLGGQSASVLEITRNQKKRPCAAAAVAATERNDLLLPSQGEGGCSLAQLDLNSIAGSPSKRRLSLNHLIAATTNSLQARASPGNEAAEISSDDEASDGSRSPVLVSCFAEDGQSPEGTADI
jgi:hypothetical protein